MPLAHIIKLSLFFGHKMINLLTCCLLGLQLQTYPPAFSVPVYNSIEDWSAAELTTDSAPSPGSGSPVSPIFGGFAFSNSGSGEDWSAWDKIEQSPESDFLFKSELLDSPDLSAIPIMSPGLNTNPATTTGLDDVVFGREGINDTRPLFQTPLNLNNNTMQSQQTQSSAPGTRMSLPTPIEAPSSTTTTQTATQERRYPARSGLKRKSSNDSDSTSPSSPRSSCSPPPPQRRHTSASSASPVHKDESSHNNNKLPALGPKKTAHNMIEKRYRTNLNDKIAALRDSVPALRVMVHRLEQNPNGGVGNANDMDVMEEIKAEAGLDPNEDVDLGGLTPAHKLNKATILSKATEYIALLERKNRALAKENTSLRNRVEGFEMLVMSRSGQQRSVWN